MGTGLLSASFLTALFASGVRQSIPLIYGSLGDAVSERAGVMGISLEGEMLFGAFFSYLVALRTGSLWLGVLVGALAGMRVFHHKTKHWYFVWGIPLILLAQMALAVWLLVR